MSLLECQGRKIQVVSLLLLLWVAATHSFCPRPRLFREKQHSSIRLCRGPRPNPEHVICMRNARNDVDNGRRQFLKQVLAFPTLLLPPVAFAAEDEQRYMALDDGEGDEEKNALDEDEEGGLGQAEPLTADESGLDADLPLHEESDEKKSNEDEERLKEDLDKVEAIIKKESELDTEVLQEESDEKKAIEDEEQLITDLESEIKTIDDMADENVEGEAEGAEEATRGEGKIKGETEALIQEEEKLKTEAEDMITKIEALESEVKSLDDIEKGAEQESGDATTKIKANDAKVEPMGEARTEIGDATTAPMTTTEKPSDAFVEKLKERVEQKEDLITRLKRQSENDIDPKTGKYKPMTKKDYRDRVKSTDTDFMQFLKDTLANEKEWERDLESFEGLLKREFGPTVKELKKDLEPLVERSIEEAEKDLIPLAKEAENEIRKDIVPAVENAMGKLRERAGSAADSEVEELKQNAEGLIGKLRGIF